MNDILLPGKKQSSMQTALQLAGLGQLGSDMITKAASKKDEEKQKAEAMKRRREQLQSGQPALGDE